MTKYKSIGIYGSVIVALIIALGGYVVTDNTYFCPDNPQVLRECVGGLSTPNANGISTRCYLNEQKSSYNTCNQLGWQKALAHIIQTGNESNQKIEIQQIVLSNFTTYADTAFNSFGDGKNASCALLKNGIDPSGIYPFIEGTKFGANVTNTSGIVPLSYICFSKSQFGVDVGVNYDDICLIEGSNCTQNRFSYEGLNYERVDFYWNVSLLVDPSFYLPVTSPQMLLSNIQGEFSSGINMTHLEINDTAERYLSLDGTGDYITAPDAAQLTGENMTFSFWLNPTAIVNSDTLVAKRESGSVGEYLLREYTGNTFEFSRQNGSSFVFEQAPANSLQTGIWQLITITAQAGGYRFYVNGTLVKTVNYATPLQAMTDTTGVLAIGNDPLATSRDVQGGIDEFMVFTRVLSQQEITDIYNLNRLEYNGSTQSLTVYHTFDNRVRRATDSSGYGNYLTYLADATTVTDTSNPSYPTPSLYSDLLAYYSFDADTSTRAFDLSKNRLNGSFVADATTLSTNGIYDDYLELDGTGDTMNVPDSSMLDFTNGAGTDSPFSITLWMQYDNTNTQTLFSKSDGNFTNTSYYGYIRSGDHIAFIVQTTTTAALGRRGSGGLSPGNWYHIAVTYNGSGTNAGLKIYVNGTQHDNTDFGSGTYAGMLNNPHALRFGNAVGSSANLNGREDDIMVFGKALTQAEIQAIYTNQSPRFKSSGVQTHKFVVLNESTNSVNLSLSSFERNYSSQISGRVGYWDVSKGYNESDGIENGLVGYWHGDYLDTSIVNDSGAHMLHGTALNGATTTDGIVSNAGRLDGVDDYIGGIGLPQQLKLPGNGTISIWLKSNSTKTYQTAVANENWATLRGGYSLWVSSGSTLIAELGSGAAGQQCSIGSAVTTNTWGHYVMTWNGSNITIFKNGVSIRDCGQTVSPSSYAQSFNIGRQPVAYSGDNAYFSGLLDEVMIFNRSLTNAEVLNIYTNQSEGLRILEGDSSLVAYYHLDELYYGAKDALNISNGVFNGGMNASGSGVFNSSFVFDGVDDFVKLPTALNITRRGASTSATVSAWIKTSVFDTTKVYQGNTPKPILGDVYASAGKGFGVNGSRLQYCSYFTAWQCFNGAAIVNDGAWHHVAVTHGGNSTGNVNLYVDGVLDGTTTMFIEPLYFQYSSIGGGYNNGQDVFNGSIDEVMLFNRSLSADEIKSLYIKGRANYQYTDWKPLTSEGKVTLNMPGTPPTVISPEWSMNSSGFYTPYIKNQAFGISTFADLFAPAVYFTSRPTGQMNNSFTFSYEGFDFLLENPASLNFGAYIYNSTGNLANFTLTSLNHTVDASHLPSDNYTFKVNVTDASGNGNSTGIYSIIFDKSSPVGNWVNLTTEQGSYEGLTELSLNYSATDAHTSMANITLRLSDGITTYESTAAGGFNNKTFSGLAFGAWSANAESCDIVGNCINGTNQTWTLSSDLTPPSQVNVTSPIQGMYYTTDTILFNISAFDSGSGLHTIWYGNGSVNYTYSGPTQVEIPPTQQTWFFYANDTFGNLNNTVTRTFNVNNHPQFTNTNPFVNASTYLRFDCSAIDSSPITYLFQVNYSNTNYCSGSSASCSFSCAVDPNLNYTVFITAMDNFSHSNTTSFNAYAPEGATFNVSLQGDLYGFGIHGIVDVPYIKVRASNGSLCDMRVNETGRWYMFRCY